MPKPYTLELNYFYGNIARHSKDIGPLITGHPRGFVASYNRKTYGLNEWERRYNYPDWGFSFIYQDLDNESIGDVYGLYSHYSFYFLKRAAYLKVGQGIGYATNPFDIIDNKKNTAFGSHFLSATFLQLNYQKTLFTVSYTHLTLPTICSV